MGHERNKSLKHSQILTLAASIAIFSGCAAWHENFQEGERISFNQMTPEAQATVRTEIGNQPITAITREYKYGDPTYRVEVQRATINPTLWVAADGSIIKESRRLVGANMTPVYDPAGASTSKSHTQNSSSPSMSQSSQPMTSNPTPTSTPMATPTSTTTTHYKTAHSPRQSNY